METPFSFFQPRMYSYLVLFAAVITLYIVNSAKHNNTNLRQESKHSFNGYSAYPTSIRNIRLRKYDGSAVERGRLELLGGVSPFTLQNDQMWTHQKRVSLNQFRKILQCAPNEPNLDANGILSLLKLLPVTKHSIELTCAYAEQPCLDVHKRVQLQDCAETALKLKQNKRDNDKLREGPSDFIRLMRVINGSLYYDWPWNLPPEKDKKLFERNWLELRLFVGVLEKISNMPDSVFISLAFDYYLLPPFFPFPVFSHGPAISSSDISWPWVLVFNDEVLYHQKLYSISSSEAKDMNSESDKFSGLANFGPDNETVWESRVNKAAFFGALWFSKESVARQVVLDLSIKYPDYIVANFSKEIGPSDYFHYDPSYPENKEKPGTLKHLSQTRIKDNKNRIPLNSYMSKYKYLPVLAGNSISERFNYFLAHSGAVVLLQQTDLQYHFSSRVKPWVHYVPLSYTAADLVEKVKWLQEHDDLARQIARNGWNFGQSYLRLEDYYCYAAAALYEVSQVESDDALQPYSKLTPIFKS